MKKVLAISSVLLGVVFLAGCGQQPVSQTQPTTPAPVAQTPTQPVATQQSTTPPVVKNEVTLGSVKLNLAENFKAIKSNHIVDSIGSQFTLIKENNLTSLAWAIVPNSFKGNESDLFPWTENVSFATLVVKDLDSKIVTGNALDINMILDLTVGEYADGFATSYTIVKQEVVGKNVSGDDIYVYDYIVNEADNKKLKLQPAREFNGAFWIHANKVYILQDQTQVGTWGENKVNTAKSNLKDKILSMALSSKIEE